MRTTKPADELDLDGDADCTCDAVEMGGGYVHREWCGSPMFGPMRIQRRRIKGWRKPEGAVFVGRPSRFGNPFPVCEVFPTPELVVRMYRDLVTTGEAWWWTDLGDPKWEKANVIRRKTDQADLTPEAIRAGLRGKDLMCWCSLDQPCHADVLLEIANAEVAA